MRDPSSDDPEPANLRFLRRLTTVLTGVMILGLVTIIALFVIQFRAVTRAPAPGADPAGVLDSARWPEMIALPPGQSAISLTRGPEWIAVVTDAGQILIYDLSGRMVQQITVTLPGAD